MTSMLTVIALELGLLCILVAIGLSMFDRAERRRTEAEALERKLNSLRPWAEEQ